MTTFAEKLRNLRRIKGLSQDELAAELGTSQRVVSAWELGKAKPRGLARVRGHEGDGMIIVQPTNGAI